MFTFFFVIIIQYILIVKQMIFNSIAHNAGNYRYRYS
nr:MAG TPA: hypothetical protein [Caudoviricetes sp.]